MTSNLLYYLNEIEQFIVHLFQKLNSIFFHHLSYRIIRRRVIWLIGCWIGVKFSTSHRHELYEALIPLLQPSEDMAVRIEAAATLKIDILFISAIRVNLL